MKKVILLACLSISLAACGMGRHVQKGINSYNAGDLNSAMSIWQNLERDEAGMNQKGLMRYLVYRGLTHHRMGHHQWALQFLNRGRAAYMTSNPQWLPSHIVVEMNQALAQLGSGTQPANPQPTPNPAPGSLEPVDIQ